MAGRGVKNFVAAGLLAGLLGGVVTGLAGLALAEPQLERAILVEEGFDQRGEDHATAAAAIEVPRDMQKLGLVVATGLYGMAIGGLIALVFSSVRGRTAHRSDRTLALTVTAALFVAMVAIPFGKYPASPPGVGDPATIAERTEVYLVLIAGSLAALLAAWRVARLLADRPGWIRALSSCATATGLAVVLVLALPGISEVPRGYPTDVLRDFRIASFGLQLTLWTVLAISFVALTGRGRRAESPAAPPRG